MGGIETHQLLRTNSTSLFKKYKAKQHRNNICNKFGESKKISEGYGVSSILTLGWNNQSSQHQDIECTYTWVDIVSTLTTSLWSLRMSCVPNDCHERVCASELYTRWRSAPCWGWSDFQRNSPPPRAELNHCLMEDAIKIS